MGAGIFLIEELFQPGGWLEDCLVTMPCARVRGLCVCVSVCLFPLLQPPAPQIRKHEKVAKHVSPYSFQKTPRTPKLSKICPSDCFWGFQQGGQKFAKNLSKLKNGNFQTNFDRFSQIFGPLTGTPKNNRWDKFWTNLGFGVFLKAVRGKRLRKGRDIPHHQTSGKLVV